MPSTHVVDQFELAIAFGDEEQALGQQAWLERFVKREALPAIEAVFDQVSSGDELLSIERLEIDLGRSAGADDAPVLVGRLRERLHRALLDARRDAVAGEGARVTPWPLARRQALNRFLASGQWRWPEGDDVAALAAQVLDDDAQAVQALLLQPGPRGDAVRRRWSQQLGHCAVPALAQAWLMLEQALDGPLRSGWYRAWRLLFTHEPARLGALMRWLGRSARVRRRIASVFTARMRHELLGLIVSAPRRDELLHWLAQAGSGNPQRDALLWESLLGWLWLEGEAGLEPQLQLPQGLLLHLEAALAQGDMGALGAAWPVLLRHDRAGLRELLRRQGRRVQRLLARGLPAAMRSDMLALVGPAESSAIAAFIARAGAWHAAGGARTMAGADFERWLWQLALAPLLSTPGAAPSAAACISAMLQHIAHAMGLPQATLLAQLQSDLAGAPAADPATQQVLQILQVLAPADPAPRGAAAAAPSMPARSAVEQRVAALCAWLQADAPASIDEVERWRAEAEHLLATARETLRPALWRALDRPRAAARLIGSLRGSTMDEMLALLRPADHARARECARLVVQACAEVVPAAPAGRLERWSWQFLLRELVEEGRRFAAAAFSGRLIDYLAGKLPALSLQGWRDALRAAVQRLAGGTQATLACELAAAPPAPVAEADAPEPVDVRNAGLVLAAPYVPRLFAMLDLTRDEAFVDELAEERALHVLTYLVHGREGAAEHALALDKLLCGVEPVRPVARDVALTVREKEAADGLLHAMVGHWTALGHTSIAGLRETFLQRDGRLWHNDGHWQLAVAAGPFDVLMDRLPWGYATVRLPWMTEVLHVQWR